MITDEGSFIITSLLLPLVSIVQQGSFSHSAEFSSSHWIYCDIATALGMKNWRRRSKTMMDNNGCLKDAELCTFQEDKYSTSDDYYPVC
mmetsp:Transcript_34679/g.54657  ORF Transcript_34679/g.54657 Transcript_34679/m.54657 type:complete len:89 (+) Transcript_34679:181-447(+)